MPTAAAQRAAEAEKQRKRVEYQRKYRIEHKEKIAAQKRAYKQRKRLQMKGENEHIPGELLYSSHPRFAVVIGHSFTFASEAVIELRPLEPEDERFLVRIKTEDGTTFRKFGDYKSCLRYLRSHRIFKIRTFPDISDLWLSERQTD